jgi:hypothetical protein
MAVLTISMPSSDLKLRISKAYKQYYLSAQNTLIISSLFFYNLESALSTNIDVEDWLTTLHLSVRSGNTLHHPCNRKYSYFLLLILHRPCSRHDTSFPLVVFQPMPSHTLCTVHQQACVHFQSFGFLLLLCCGGWCPLYVYNFTCVSQFTVARSLVLSPLVTTPSVCFVTDPHMLQFLSPIAACMQLTHWLSSKPFVPLCSSLSSKPSLTASWQGSLSGGQSHITSFLSVPSWGYKIHTTMYDCSLELTVFSMWFKIKEYFHFSHSICWYILCDLWNNWQLFF